MANVIIAAIMFMLARVLIMAYKYARLQDAIYNYRIYCIKHWEKANVDFKDMVRYKKIVFHVFNWRYTDILPKEKFELIKPYMKGK